MPEVLFKCWAKKRLVSSHVNSTCGIHSIRKLFQQEFQQELQQELPKGLIGMADWATLFATNWLNLRLDQTFDLCNLRGSICRLVGEILSIGRLESGK